MGRGNDLAFLHVLPSLVRPLGLHTQKVVRVEDHQLHNIPSITILSVMLQRVTGFPTVPQVDRLRERSTNHSLIGCFPTTLQFAISTN
jgi:hypothetical protein